MKLILYSKQLFEMSTEETMSNPNQTTPPSTQEKQYLYDDCNCTSPHNPELDIILAKKNFLSKQACKKWSKGKRYCNTCQFLVEPIGHPERCGKGNITTSASTEQKRTSAKAVHSDGNHPNHPGTASWFCRDPYCKWHRSDNIFWGRSL